MDEDELWLPVVGSPSYLVSNYGRVYDVRYEQLVQPRLTNDGYLVSPLKETTRTIAMFVHRLVAFVFVAGYFDNALVNHIDGDKTYNYYENLEWVTHKGNNQHALDIGLRRGLQRRFETVRDFEDRQRLELTNYEYYEKKRR
jgi:hypothetical protein